MNTRWKPNNHNIFAFWLIIAPFITNVPFSLLTGYYADKNDVSEASLFNMRGYVDLMRRRHVDELRVQELQITRQIIRDNIQESLEHIILFPLAFFHTHLREHCAINIYLLQHVSFGKKSRRFSPCRNITQISTEPIYITESVELHQMTIHKTNDHENTANIRAPKSHHVDKRRNSISEATKRLSLSSRNVSTLFSVDGTTLVSGQFGSTDQTLIIENHEFVDSNSINWQDTDDNCPQKQNDEVDDLSYSIRDWLTKKPLRCDLAKKS
ncbi:3856_t:CDS:2 [Scutellospora calospora]|uniref:3856_t:CDS:1 n=1 Tax=Scutellospora calospora TaxID=85575 RepID=A0ACA9KB20_9GLOM|nr:3856_t:CDS:2 [Scutellospora calospora]